MTTEHSSREHARTTDTPAERARKERAATDAASAVSFIAGMFMLLLGAMQFLQGFAALVSGTILVSTPNYIFALDTTVWGWIHMGLGALIVVAGGGVLANRTWGRWLAIVLVGLSIVANFLWLPHYPLWSLVLIALGVLVIWGLGRANAAGTASSRLF